MIKRLHIEVSTILLCLGLIIGCTSSPIDNLTATVKFDDFQSIPMISSIELDKATQFITIKWIINNPENVDHYKLAFKTEGSTQPYQYIQQFPVEPNKNNQDLLIITENISINNAIIYQYILEQKLSEGFTTYNFILQAISTRNYTFSSSSPKALKYTGFMSHQLNITPNDALIHPTGITLDSNKNIYVSDTLNSRIQKYAPSGSLMATYGTAGSGEFQFRYPRGLTYDGSRIWVADSGNNRIIKFDPDNWGESGDPFIPINNLDNPIAVRANPSNLTSVVYSSLDDHRIHTGPTSSFQDSNATLFAYDLAHYDNDVYIVNKELSIVQRLSNNELTQFNTIKYGTSTGNIKSPEGMAIDSANHHLYVSDTFNHRIQIFDIRTGLHVANWGQEGSDTGEFKFPRQLHYDSSARTLYVVDSGNNRIQIFKTNDDT